MMSFRVFASFYCSLSPAEQFTLRISIEDSFPTGRAMLTADYLVERVFFFFRFFPEHKAIFK